MDRFVIHTNFTATVATTHEIALAELATARNLEILRYVFHEPDKLKPGVTSAAVTTEAAGHLAEIAERMRKRRLDPATVAHFLDRLVFCLFAEDVGLLPENLFSRIVEKSNLEPKRFTKLIGQLFEAMAHGGDFGMDTIHYFNGNLFAGSTVLELEAEEIGRILAATKLHWSAVDPSIFGTLFVRGMDPAQRSQLGAQYTSREDIETLVEPVVMDPLRREWADRRQQVENLLATGKKTPSAKAKPPAGAALTKARREAETLLKDFCGRLQLVRVLDPACGSGNFLYVTLQKLKDLEKEVCVYANSIGMGGFLPAVGPWHLYGIEISPYAFDLAQMTIWIGWLQWIRANGYGSPSEPILRPLDTFQCKDAILDLSDPDNPKEPEWPEVDFIIGNPPFLGGKRMRSELGDRYVDALFWLWNERVRPEADLCCYWFEKGRHQIEEEKCKRAGLLATQGIRSCPITFAGFTRDIYHPLIA
jgi:SAM-dependent methyltransferase